MAITLAFAFARAAALRRRLEANEIHAPRRTQPPHNDHLLPYKKTGLLGWHTERSSVL